MKSKKIFLPIIILSVAVLAIIVFSLVSSIAQKPTITEGEFPFSITYEIDGETLTINDVYKVRYIGNEGYANTKSRVYVGEIGDMGEENTIYTIKQEGNTRIELLTHLYADYLMGDSKYDYFDDEDFEPRIYYYDSEDNEYHDEETLFKQGVKLIDFDYPEPLENSFVFSHISYFSGEVVFPTLLIAIFALATTLIFARKEKDLQYKAIDKISILLNFVISFTLVPFVTIVAVLIDINGGNPEFYRQILYFIPSFWVLCITASVALRRKGYGKNAVLAQLIAPAVFIIYLIICGVLGLL